MRTAGASRAARYAATSSLIHGQVLKFFAHEEALRRTIPVSRSPARGFTAIALGTPNEDVATISCLSGRCQAFP